jgi:hypothetical protein
MGKMAEVTIDIFRTSYNICTRAGVNSPLGDDSHGREKIERGNQWKRCVHDISSEKR